jgi:FeS assembly SUF system protein
MSTATAAISTDPWDLKPPIVAALRTIHDPEIPVNIYDLGLVYALEIYPGGRVRILMTLTTPGCPVAQEFPATVAQVVKQVPGVSGCEVEIVWEPPWTSDRIPTADRLRLGLL